MRYCYWIVILGVIGLALIGYYQADTITAAGTYQSLNDAMAGAGALTQEVRINAWVDLPSADLSDEDMTDLARRSMSRLGLDPGQYELRHIRSEGHRMVRAQAQVDQARALVVVQVRYLADERRPSAAYLTFEVATRTGNAAGGDWIGKVATAATGVGGVPRLTTCLVGWLDGKLEQDEWVSRLHRAGKTMNTVVLDTIVQPDYAGLTGFSPRLPAGVRLGDKQVNVNMAMRYSPLDNRTYILIGSPMITGEY